MTSDLEPMEPLEPELCGGGILEEGGIQEGQDADDPFGAGAPDDFSRPSMKNSNSRASRLAYEGLPALCTIMLIRLDNCPLAVTVLPTAVSCYLIGSPCAQQSTAVTPALR